MGFVCIVSPAKKMNVVDGPPSADALPQFIARAEELKRVVQSLTYEEAKALWKCSDRLAQLNYERFACMDLRGEVSAAVAAYEGIQYQHMAPQVMSEEELTWMAEHLRIISGFYGVLRPLDGVVPYRLEMQARLAVGSAHNLYEYWGDTLARALAREADAVVNLASVEYAKAVLPWAEAAGLRVLTCVFGEVRGGRFVQRATEAKAARGTFVRWCAERNARELDELQGFGERGYLLDEARSDSKRLVFVRTESQAGD